MRKAMAWMMYLAATVCSAAPLEGNHWAIATQGWYTLVAKADGEASLALVDRAAGELKTLKLEQDAKVWSGRTSLFLEPGDYQLRWKKEAAVHASVEGIAYPVSNAVSGNSPLLAERTSLRTTLGDRQSLAWRVVVPQGASRLSLAVRGRNVSAVVLWREGIWDVGLPLKKIDFQPVPKRPYHTFEIDQEVLPGFYTLQVFGGPREVWGDESNIDPVVISRDGDYLPEGAIRDLFLDGEGRSEWQLGPTVSLVQAELPAGDFRLRGGSLRYQDYSSTSSVRAADPIRVASMRVSQGTRWLIVEGPPGAKVRLRALSEGYGEALSVGGVKTTTLVTASAAATAADGYPLTGVGVTVNTNRRDVLPNVVWEQTLLLSSDSPIHLITNNTGSSSFLLRVKTPGSFAVVERKPGGTATYEFQLFDDKLSGNGTKAQKISGDGVVELQAKLYWVTSRPLVAGRSEWSLVSSGLGQGLAANGLWGKAANTTKESWAAVFPMTPKDYVTTLWVPSREGVPNSVSVQTLPMEAANLPSLSLDQKITLSMRFPDGTLSGSGQATVDGAVPGAVAAGVHQVTLEGTRVEQRFLPKATEPAHDAIPLLNPGQSSWDDWKAGQIHTYDLQVPTPGLYRIETQGRLSMAARVRTPLQRSLLQASRNFGGTNARLYAFLNPGLYRIEVEALDATSGRGGVTLIEDTDFVTRTLVPGTQARATVPGDRMLKIDLKIPKDASYQVTSLGLNQDFVRRFEDAEGYPVDKPLANGGGTWTLAAGNYRLWSYPLPSQSRRLYGLIDRTFWDNQPARSRGWNQPFQSTWKESPERTPDEYKFVAEAPLKAQVVLSADMVWEAWAGDKLLERHPGGEPFAIDLPAGPIVFRVRSQIPDNLKDYSFEVLTIDLTPGRSIVVSDGKVPVTVGRDSTYELSLWGGKEGKLSLYTEAGTLVARGTPRSDDWNASISAFLKAGRYIALVGQFDSLPVAAPAAEQPSSEDHSADYSDYSEEDDSEGEYAQGDGSEDSQNESLNEPVEQPVVAWTPWTEARFLGDVNSSPLLSMSQREEAAAPPVLVGKGEVWGSRLQVRTVTPPQDGVYRIQSDAGQLAVFRLERGETRLAQASSGFLIPLKAKIAYRLTSWWEDPTDRPVDWSMELVADANTVARPERTSLRLPGALTSAAWETPFFEAPDGWMTARDSTLWWWSEHPAAPEPVRLDFTRPLAVPLGTDAQSIPFETPVGSVGLISVRGAGQEVGVSVHAPGPPPEWNWSQARLTAQQTAVGVPAGKAVLRLWNPETTETRWTDVNWSVFPVVSVTGSTGTVEPGKAVSLKPGAKALQFVLEEDLVAFALDASGNRPLPGPVAGVLAGSSWAIVNTGTKVRTWRAQPAPLNADLVTDTQPYEKKLDMTTDSVIEVRGAVDSEVRVSFETADSVRWGAATSSRWNGGEMEAGPSGQRLVFKGGRGTVFLKGVRGWLRIWTSPAGKADAGLGLDGPRAPLAAEGAILSAGVQSWNFTPAKAGFYSFEADDAGILALAKDGKVLASSWASDRRSLLVKLSTDTVTVTARPFAGSAQSGFLRVAFLEPQTGSSQLIGPGERQLWPLNVTAPGRVGLAVSAPAEGLNLRLFKPDYTPLASGPIFWRSLTPGSYWLVVEGTDQTLVYHPIFLGLEGSQTGVPDQVRATFEQGNAP